MTGAVIVCTARAGIDPAEVEDVIMCIRGGQRAAGLFELA